MRILLALLLTSCATVTPDYYLWNQIQTDREFDRIQWTVNDNYARQLDRYNSLYPVKVEVVP